MVGLRRGGVEKVAWKRWRGLRARGREGEGRGGQGAMEGHDSLTWSLPGRARRGQAARRGAAARTLGKKRCGRSFLYVSLGQRFLFSCSFPCHYVTVIIDVSVCCCALCCCAHTDLADFILAGS